MPPPSRLACDFDVVQQHQRRTDRTGSPRCDVAALNLAASCLRRIPPRTPLAGKWNRASTNAPAPAPPRTRPPPDTARALGRSGRPPRAAARLTTTQTTPTTPAPP